MRHAYISTVMAGVPVITSAGSVRAQEADTGATAQTGITLQQPPAAGLHPGACDGAGAHPAAARPDIGDQPRARERKDQGRGGVRAHRHARRRRDRFAGDEELRLRRSGMAGGFYGVLIGTPLGAWFGVWLAGR